MPKPSPFSEIRILRELLKYLDHGDGVGCWNGRFACGVEFHRTRSVTEIKVLDKKVFRVVISSDFYSLLLNTDHVGRQYACAGQEIENMQSERVHEKTNGEKHCIYGHENVVFVRIQIVHTQPVQ